jgi:phosphatidylinositol glycan class B
VTGRAYLVGILLLALAIRLAVIFSGPYIVHPDELYQYYEQGYRLAFGSGVVPWEFHDGARSWLIPGILAAIMTASRWISANPLFYVDGIRILCAILSLIVVYVGFETARRRDGLLGALVTGTLCAIWIDPIYLAPSVMGEVLSAYCFLAAYLIADEAEQSPSPKRMAFAGALLGLAVCFRVQTGPAMAVFAILSCRFEWRRRWLPLVVGGVAVVLLDLGLLDWLTWGAPFHSIWLYLLRGLFEKFAGGYAEGTSSAVTYAELIAAAWALRALPLALFAVIGAFRRPVLGAVVVTIVATHLVFANAEYRYLSTALFACPILMGAGVTYFCGVVRRVVEARSGNGGRAEVFAGSAVVAYAAFACWVAVSYGLLFRTLDRNIFTAFLAAHRQPQLCGLGAVGIGWAEGWSYTYLDRDVPLYGGSYSAAKPISPTISVPQSVVLRGKALPIFSDDEMTHETLLYNFLIAPPDRGLAGYSKVECFGSEPNPANPQLCLFTRPGPCAPPLATPQPGG